MYTVRVYLFLHAYTHILYMSYVFIWINQRFLLILSVSIQFSPFWNFLPTPPGLGLPESGSLSHPFAPSLNLPCLLWTVLLNPASLCLGLGLSGRTTPAWASSLPHLGSDAPLRPPSCIRYPPHPTQVGTPHSQPLCLFPSCSISSNDFRTELFRKGKGKEKGSALFV